ncbi:MAG TPA: ABC transporter substrate-binding protein [Erysipelotrichaceae bacterium]|nr:ABC transporter substrate-binding protein [Erysipelotrichaceae bacterium]
MKRLFIVLICVLLLIGCNNKEVSTGEVVNEEFITFIDALDREVTIKKNPEKVAALLGSFADVWILAGGEICATAEDAWDDFGLDLDAVNIGGAHSPSLELLLSSNPEFVIASASTSSNVEMKETLEDAGITVAYFDVDNFYDYLEMLDICTDITGRKDLYATNGLEIEKQIEEIKDEFNKEEISEKEKTVLLLRTASSFVKAKGSEGTILGEMLDDMGCINIADNDETLLENLSVEAIIKEEPYHIFVVTMGSDTKAAMESLENLINENPAWNTLDAIKQDRMYVMDKKLFNLKPNANWANSYQELYEILKGK